MHESQNQSYSKCQCFLVKIKSKCCGMHEGIQCSSVKRNLCALKWIDSVLYKAVNVLINYCDTEQYQKNYGEQT